MTSEQKEAESQVQAAQRLSAGALLRELRTKQGLHIGAMAAMLKVPQAKLEALENDRLGELPDATFARALAKAMCRVLKADSEPVLGLLPRGNEPELMVSRGLNQAYREHDVRAEGLSLTVFQRPMVFGAVVLLAAAAGVFLLPSDFVEKMRQTQTQTPSPDSAVVSLPSTPVQVAASAPELAEPILVDSPLAASIPSQMPLLAPGSAGSSAAPVVAAAVRAVSDAAAPLAGSTPLIVKTSAESWVEVIDARGQVLLSRTLRAGEELPLAGMAPVKIKVGNVAGTEVSLRGRKIDLVGQAQNNVARLELN